MEFIISRSLFLQLLSKVQSTISQKAALPVLGNVLIEAKNHTVVISGTDLTVGIKAQGDAKVLKEGTTTLPAKKLTQLVKEMTSATIQVQTSPEDITTLIAGSSRFKLHGLSSTEYPPFPDLSNGVKLTLDAPKLKSCLSKVSFAVLREDNRYILTGALLQVKGKDLIFVGTDGKRLARAELSLEEDSGHRGSYVIPLKGVEEFLRNLETEGSVTLVLTADKVALATPDTILMTKLLAGEFPDFTQVIPGQAEHVVSLHREELMSLLRQVSLFTAETAQPVRFSFLPAELQLSANAMDVGEGKVSMPVNYQGPEFHMAFNPQFFLDILRHCQEEIVYLGVSSPYEPGVVTDQTPNGKSFTPHPTPLFVVMPMRLEEAVPR